VATLWYLVAFAAVAGAITPAPEPVPASVEELQH
jgi:hypothetical protein